MSLHIAVDIGGTSLRAATYLHNSQTPLQLSRIAIKNAQDTPLEREYDGMVVTPAALGEEPGRTGALAPERSLRLE